MSEGRKKYWWGDLLREKAAGHKDEEIPFEGPPCRACACWSPRRVPESSEKGFAFGGIRLCWSTKMYSDFSCYVHRGGEK